MTQQARAAQTQPFGAESFASQDETVLRWCIVNPLTTADDLAAIVDSLADG